MLHRSVAQQVAGLVLTLTLLATGLVAGATLAGAQEMTCDVQHPVPPNLALSTDLADENDPAFSVATMGTYAVWWYSEFDHADDAQILLTELASVRCDALLNFGQQDPPNPAAGLFFNVYIHHGTEDAFPSAWANGVGTNPDGFPFMALQHFLATNKHNTDHEGFHSMTWAATSPGYEYAGDSQWFIETSAQWFAATRNPDSEDSFVQAAAIEANPHLALWHSFSNEAPGDETGWYYQLRQYGLHTLLVYLTEVAGASSTTMGEGFYNGTAMSPQQYIATQIGLNTLRRNFADWAAANVADFDYLSPAQVARARQEPLLFADPGTANPLAGEWTATGTVQMVRPTAGLEPRGWAYNVLRLNAPDAKSYRVVVQGDATGSEGGPSKFLARVVVHGSGGYRHVDVPMANGSGDVVVEIAPGETRVDVVVASVPDHFTGNQTYGYRYFVGDASMKFCNGLPVTIDMSTGAAGIGTAAADVIQGTVGDDVIDAGDGDDTVCAGDGNDIVVGGPGDDVLFGGAGNDIMRGNSGVDLLEGGAGTDRLLGGIDADTLNGGAGEDFLGGFGGDDTINGGPGNDTIFGGFGADLIDGGAGNDVIRGLIGNDTIRGGGGDDVLDGDQGNDQINGSAGNDTIRGGNANDVLSGDAGDDSVSGGKADDTLSGGLGTDVCIGNLQNVADTADTTCETIFGVP